MKLFGSLCIAIGLTAAFASLATTGAKAQSAFGAPLFAVLNGGNECNGAAPPACRQGDLNGIGSATITFAHRDATTRWVCFGLTVDNVGGVTAAHIHSGVAGLNGAIVVGLAPPVAPGGGDPGAAGNCVPAPIATVNAIRADPTAFYVNVHSAAFPAGAVRGQLH